MNVFAHGYARLALASAASLIVLVVAGVGAANQCEISARNDIHRISWLETEIAFRRTAVLDALEKASSREDLDAAEYLLTPQAPYRVAESQGQSLSELMGSYRYLRRNLIIEDRDGRPVEEGQVLGEDPWLMGNFPTEQVGSFYGVSPDQLESLRLAARQRLAHFIARQISQSGKDADLQPDCSGGNILSFFLSGGSEIAVKRTGVSQPIR